MPDTVPARRWWLAALVALLSLGLLAPVAQAGTLVQRTVQRGVAAYTPAVVVSGTGATVTWTLSAGQFRLLREVHVRIRPVDAPGDSSRDVGHGRDVRLRGSRTSTATVTGLSGAYTAAAAWTLDGVTWLQGPAASFTVTPSPAPAAEPRVYGTLQSTTANLPATTAAGFGLVTFGVAWKRFEPVEGQVDPVYLAALRADLAAFRAAGSRVVLDVGVHHPPSWAFSVPHSRYQNQYGEVYASTETGKKIANMVFNQALRDKQAAYLGRLFGALGTDFWGVRLGGGWYGELNYPEHTFAGRTNAYWGFDPVALGAAPGLPAGMTANPVPSWRPGAPSPAGEAGRFAEWYMESLRHYHDWQITTARRWYAGSLMMMYPSWGIRPGQLQAAVAGDLSGATSAERNGEVQRGFDVGRFVRGITDPGVVVYTTWLNADASADGGTDQRYWSPVKYLAHLARDRAQPLTVMGENTGRDTVADVELSFRQARRYGLTALVWAFEPELFGGVYASLADLAAAIRADRLAG